MFYVVSRCIRFIMPTAATCEWLRHYVFDLVRLSVRAVVSAKAISDRLDIELSSFFVYAVHQSVYHTVRAFDVHFVGDLLA